MEWLSLAVTEEIASATAIANGTVIRNHRAAPSSVAAQIAAKNSSVKHNKYQSTAGPQKGMPKLPWAPAESDMHKKQVPTAMDSVAGLVPSDFISDAPNA